MGAKKNSPQEGTNSYNSYSKLKKNRMIQVYTIKSNKQEQNGEKPSSDCNIGKNSSYSCLRECLPHPLWSLSFEMTSNKTTLIFLF